VRVHQSHDGHVTHTFPAQRLDPAQNGFRMGSSREAVHVDIDDLMRHQLFPSGQKYS
jgi:hypothetical protein